MAGTAAKTKATLPRTPKVDELHGAVRQMLRCVQFKLGSDAVACIKAAQSLGKWTHVGRVNTPERFDKFKDLGVDSIDGTGLSRYTHMRASLNGANSLFENAERGDK